MSRETAIIAYVCDTVRLRASVQETLIKREKLTDEVWEEGRKAHALGGAHVQQFDLLRMKLRRGDTLVVCKLFVLAPGRKDRHKRLVQRVNDLIEAGVHIRQIKPPMTTRKTADRGKMLADAMGDLTRVGWHKSTGRPRAERSPEDVEIIRRHWKSAEHATDAAALDAMKRDGLKDWTVSMIIQAKLADGSRLFGPSGRPYTKRKPRKK